ncbi:MAG: hypothetical protein KBT57_03180 [bacterium]|nr:hypothetical protein [Candidatus Limimorpha equi]
METIEISLNHEIWAVCPVCGCEYDARIWGDTCPECARRKAKEIRQMARYPMTVKFGSLNT